MMNAVEIQNKLVFLVTVETGRCRAPWPSIGDKTFYLLRD